MVRWLAARRVNPDLLTFSALGLAVGAAICLYLATNDNNLLLVVVPPVLLRLMLNALDGQVARRTGKANAWGEVKNEFCDRLADVSIFLGIGLGDYVNHWLALFAVAIILLIPYVGILSKAVGGTRSYSGVMGKPDRMVWLALIALYAWFSGNLSSFNLYFAIVIALGTITLAQRLWRLYDTLESSR